MKKKTLVFLTVLVFLYSFSAIEGYAEKKATLSLGGGFSQFTGDGSDIWETGYTTGGTLFFKVTPNILVGGRFAYNRWSLDEEALIRDIGIPWANFTVSGSASAIELIPSVRILAPARKGSKIKFFGQVGAGLYRLNLETNISTTAFILLDNIEIHLEETRFGVDIGGGVIFGGQNSIRFEILPQYHIIWTKDNPTKYFSLSLGAVFRL